MEISNFDFFTSNPHHVLQIRAVYCKCAAKARKARPRKMQSSPAEAAAIAAVAATPKAATLAAAAAAAKTGHRIAQPTACCLDFA